MATAVSTTPDVMNYEPGQLLPRGPVPRSSRGARLLAPVLVVFLALLALVAPQAGAASGDWATVSGANHRDCPDTRCASQRYLNPGTAVQVWCWRDGGWVDSSRRWFRVRASGVDAWVSATRMKSQPTVPYCSDMRPKETLFVGQDVWSPNGSYRLIMQSDGNVVLYGPAGAIWATRTTGTGADRLVMQADGNLVVYGAAAKWWTGTMYSGQSLAVQSDGNVVTYAGSLPTWAASWHTTRGATRTTNTAPPGNCTRYAYDRFNQDSGVYPALSGDAWAWDDSARANGWQVLPAPVTHAIVVFEKYVQGSGSYGHVAWVDAVRPAVGGTDIHVVEMNFRGLGVISDRWVRHVSGMSYITAPEK